jgi:hypothetical protein
MSRAEWILGAILVVLLAIVVIAAAALWLPKTTEQSLTPVPVTAVVAPTLSFQGGTALFAFAAANNTAREWRTDAELLEARATWPQGVTRDDITTGSGLWSFTFYSAAQNEVANIEVLENVPNLISQNKAPAPLAPLLSTGWQVDSSDAVQILLEQAGGDEFLRTQGVSILNMNLTTVSSTNRIEWIISLFSSQTGQSLTIRVDANSGEIIPATPS